MKKLISIFTMVAFMVFSLSCYSTKIMRVDAGAAKYENKGNILSMEKISGEVYEFSKTQPGKISNDRIEGVAINVTGLIEIEKANIEREDKDNDGNFLIIITKNKKVYKEFNGTVTEEEDNYIFNGTFKTSRSISIPLSEVEMIMVKMPDAEKTVFAVLGVVVAALLVPLIIVVSTTGLMFRW